MMDETWLGLAIEAMHHNDLPRARELLRGYVSYYRQDEQGWLWLSRVTEPPAERIPYLQRVLQINPGNSVASDELAALADQSGLSETAPRKPAPVPAVPTRHASRVRPCARRSVPGRSLITIVEWIALGLTLLLFLPIGATTFPIFLGNRTLVVMSGSMEPTIPAGAVVIAQPVSSKELEPGDVVVYAPNGDAAIPIIHRIVNVRVKEGTRYFTTQGDANPTVDAAEVSLAGTAWRMAYNVPLVGYAVYYAASPLGTLILIVMPLLGLGILTLWDQLKRMRSAMATVGP